MEYNTAHTDLINYLISGKLKKETTTKNRKPSVQPLYQIDTDFLTLLELDTTCNYSNGTLHKSLVEYLKKHDCVNNKGSGKDTTYSLTDELIELFESKVDDTPCPTYLVNIGKGINRIPAFISEFKIKNN